MSDLPTTLDPYDLWMTSVGVDARRAYYDDRLWGKLACIAIGVIDWWLPMLSRRLVSARARVYPITLAQWVLMQPAADNGDELLDAMLDCAAADEPSSVSWGLGFPWMSKNGLYGPETPFVTHTPYMMEALLHVATFPGCRERALAVFDKTMGFLDGLNVMFESEEELALSYAPVEEPRIVVNANAYAAWAYAMHLRRALDRGDERAAQRIESRIRKIVRWVIARQHANGAWDYYADTATGNFIDCFHTCFIVKNLHKASSVLENLEGVDRAIEAGVGFLAGAFHDRAKGLARRFVVRDIKDPYVWDLYDQAELLGVYLDVGRVSEATALAERATDVFFRKGHWYSRIDVLGRPWGRGFLRWGIMPFLYERQRLEHLSESKETCVEYSDRRNG